MRVKMKEYLLTIIASALMIGAAMAEGLSLEQARQLGYFDAAIEYCAESRHPIQFAVPMTKELAIDTVLNMTDVQYRAFQSGEEQFIDIMNNSPDLALVCMRIDASEKNLEAVKQ